MKYDHPAFFNREEIAYDVMLDRQTRNHIVCATFGEALIKAWKFCDQFSKVEIDEVTHRPNSNAWTSIRAGHVEQTGAAGFTFVPEQWFIDMRSE